MANCPVRPGAMDPGGGCAMKRRVCPAKKIWADQMLSLYHHKLANRRFSFSCQRRSQGSQSVLGYLLPISST